MNKIFIHPAFTDNYKKYPITLIDIGAGGGISKRWKKAEKYLKILGFEPDERAFRALPSTSNAMYLKTCLSNSDGELTLFLTRKQECSSAFYPNYDFLKQFPDTERFEIVGLNKLPSKQLNIQFLQSSGVYDPDFLKIDAQGEELNILDGASFLLDDFIFGIELEVEFVPIYINQPLFADIDAFLREKGFYIFDLKRYFWKRVVGATIGGTKGQLVFADVLYFKTYESFFRSIKNRNPEEKKAKILKAISICLIYGIFDYALYLCERASNDCLFSFAETEIIRKAVNKKRIRIDFRGKGRLAKILFNAYKYLKTNEFYFADEEIGNE